MSKKETETTEPKATPTPTPPLPPASHDVPTIDYDAMADRVAGKILPKIEAGLSSATKEIENLVKPKAIEVPPIVEEPPKVEPPKANLDLFGFEV